MPLSLYIWDIQWIWLRIRCLPLLWPALWLHHCSVVGTLVLHPALITRPLDTQVVLSGTGTCFKFKKHRGERCLYLSCLLIVWVTERTEVYIVLNCDVTEKVLEKKHSCVCLLLQYTKALGWHTEQYSYVRTVKKNSLDYFPIFDHIFFISFLLCLFPMKSPASWEYQKCLV